MTNDDLQQKYDSLVREYCRLMDENRKLKKKFSELQEENKILEESLYDLQEENINENFTHLNGRGYLRMSETKDNLKIQVKVILVFTVMCICGMVTGGYIFDATSYTATGIIIFLLFLMEFYWMCQSCKKNRQTVTG